jgi:hypothetical protein
MRSATAADYVGERLPTVAEHLDAARARHTARTPQ